MVKKHETDSTIFTVPVERFSEFFASCVNTVSSLIELDELFNDFLDKNIEEDELFDALDDLSLDSDAIYFIAKSFSSINISRNKYLANTAELLKVFEDNVYKIVSVGRDPDKGDVLILQKELKRVVGGLVYFVLQDFEIEDTLEGIASGGEYSIDEVFDGYLKANSLSVEEFAETFNQYYQTYKFKLEVFDEHPELEEAFEKVVGPDYNLIPEGILTVELVEQIINGEIGVDTLIPSDEED